jgi:hypothetical protein
VKCEFEETETPVGGTLVVTGNLYTTVATVELAEKVEPTGAAVPLNEMFALKQGRYR